MTTIATKYPFIGSIDTKQGGRKENQDNAGFVDTPLGLLFVVCDGMGGGPGGRTASLMAVDTILHVLSDVAEHTPREAALQFAIDKANDIIYAKAKEVPELRGMGTTVAAVLINENSAVIAHAGDTRIYQLRKGAIVYRSADHSVVANLVRQKRMTEEEARNHPQSNVVTRALGIRPSMEIEFDEVSFLRGDRFVVCTDGIWGMLPQCDLVKSLSRVMGISELTSLVAEEIDELGRMNGGGHDNLTLAIVDTPFDSAQKKIHKKSVKGDAAAPNTKKTGKLKLAIILAACVTFCVAVAVCLFLMLNNFSKSDTEKSGEPQRGKTITSVGKNTVIVRGDEDTTSQKNTQNAPPPSSDAKGIDVFNKPIETKDTDVNLIIENLDSLKRIKGQDQKQANGRKEKYIKENIKPALERLKEKIAKDKKEDVQNIITMLDNSKIKQFYKHKSEKEGGITKDGGDYIDSIKDKLKKL